MTWKVSQLNGHDLIQGSGKEDTIINVRDENQDNLFEIIPKLLIDQGLMQVIKSIVIFVSFLG